MFFSNANWLYGRKKKNSLRNHCCFKTVRILMRFIGDFQRQSYRKPLPLSTAAWLAQQKSDGLLSGRSRFQTPARTNTQGLRVLGRKFCLFNDICKRLDLLVFSDKNKKSQAPSNSPCRYNKFCCERNHTLFAKSKGPSPLWDGLLKFTFTLGGNHNYY